MRQSAIKMTHLSLISFPQSYLMHPLTNLTEDQLWAIRCDQSPGGQGSMIQNGTDYWRLGKRSRVETTPVNHTLPWTWPYPFGETTRGEYMASQFNGGLWRCSVNKPIVSNSTPSQRISNLAAGDMEGYLKRWNHRLLIRPKRPNKKLDKDQTNGGT